MKVKSPLDQIRMRLCRGDAGRMYKKAGLAPARLIGGSITSYGGVFIPRPYEHLAHLSKNGRTRKVDSAMRTTGRIRRCIRRAIGPSMSL